MTLKNQFRYFWGLPFERKLWFVFSIASSFVIWLVVRFFKARKLQVFMGHHIGNTQLCSLSSEHQSLKAWRIARVVEAVCKGVPWDCKCLTEAVCTNILLMFYRIPSVFYLGSKLEKSTSYSIKAHAWLTVGEYCIIGGQVANDGYLVTATFVRPKPSS